MASTRLTDQGSWIRRTEQRLQAVEFQALRTPPHAIISREAALSQPVAQTSIQFDTIQFMTTMDTAIWSAGNSTVFKMPLPGWWEVDAFAAFAGNATGIRHLLISHNTGGELERDIELNPTTASNTTLKCHRRMLSDGTNFFTVPTVQSSGANLALAVGHRWTRVELKYLGP